ncbi:MAG: hypothetical protein IKB38_05760 [Clostridia bacterium]|nr:hypothetical protein [Clostridia bacterium]
MILIKAITAVLVLFVAKTLSSEYKKYMEAKNAVNDGFVALLDFIRNELSCRLRSVPQWACEFENEALFDAGFISELSETGSLSRAFSNTRQRLPMLGGDAARLLESYFSSFGRSYKDDEEKSAERVYNEMSRIAVKERAESERSVRAVRILCYGAALGIIILFL